MPRHHVQPASSSPPCFSFSTDSLGADITVFLIYWFPVCRSPWKRNRPPAASLDPSVHSCLSGPQGAWHIGCAQECLLRAHVTPRDHRRHSPPAGGGFRLQAAHWERGLQVTIQARLGPQSWESLPCLCQSAWPSWWPQSINPWNPLVEMLPLDSGVRGRSRRPTASQESLGTVFRALLCWFSIFSILGFVLFLSTEV